MTQQSKKKHGGWRGSLYKGLRRLLPLFLHSFSYRTDCIPPLDEPYLMLANHLTESDMLMVAQASPAPVTFVCSGHLLQKGYGKLLKFLFDPIPLARGNTSLSAVRGIVSRMARGENVMLFPEGKRSFHGETIPVPEAVGKLVKVCGGALVTYHITGGYLAQPRWSVGKARKGHVEGRVMGVYTREALKSMTPQQITVLINRDLYENAYETQKKLHLPYKGKNLAENLEKYLFLCPECGGNGTMRSEGNALYCAACGLRVEYDEYGMLKGAKLPFADVHAWGRWEEEEFDRQVAQKSDAEVLFLEKEVSLYDMDTKKLLCAGNLTITAESMSMGEHSFRFEEVQALSLLFGNRLQFKAGDRYYRMEGKHFLAWRCGRLWQIRQGIEHDRTKEL